MNGKLSIYIQNRNWYPLKPAGTLFVCDSLCLPVLPQECLVAGAERRSTASESSAASDLAGTWEGAVIAGTNPTPVQVFG